MNEDDSDVLCKQYAKSYRRISPPFEIGNGCIYVKFVHPLKLKIRTAD